MPDQNGASAPAIPALYSAEALAQMLGVSRSTLRRLIDRGVLPKPHYLGCLPRWPAASVELLLSRMASGEAELPRDALVARARKGGIASGRKRAATAAA
ncbi:MAG: helix-turn-helix domain-containing protein [Burkholderiaceae bacterium]